MNKKYSHTFVVREKNFFFIFENNVNLINMENKRR